MNFTIDGVTIAITHPDAASVTEAVKRRLTTGNGFALATINLDHLVKLRASPAFRIAYAKQDFVVADGNPIVWLSHIAGQTVSLVPGSDLVLPLAQCAAETGRPLALVGSTEKALSDAAAYLQDIVPGLNVAMLASPAFGFDPTGPDARAILSQLDKLGPCLCFIALGAPKQEVFAALGRKLAPRAGFASVGAGVDFLSGNQIRAPKWARDLTLEWAWRLMQSPKRMLPRYIACAAILPTEILLAWRQRG